MNITFGPRGIVQIDDARIIYRNFSGAASKFNREGDRNFSLVIPDQIYKILDDETEITIAEKLVNDGWNVKIRPPREEGESPFMHLPVKIKFNDRGPAVYLKSGHALNKLTEETVGMLDDVDILSVDLDIRPYDWEVQGKTGRTAYLHSMCVTQQIDRFMERFAEEEAPEEVPF